MNRAVMWFRRDLRTTDHPALAAAVADGEVVPLFVVDPIFTRRAGAPRRAYLAAALAGLDAAAGGSLVIRHGDPVEVVPRFAAEVGAGSVYVTRDAAPYGRRRDAAVSERLVADGRQLAGVGTNYAVDPGTVTKADGGGYAVFSPFRRAWRAAGWPAPVEVPPVTWAGRGDVASEPPPAPPPLDIELPPADAASVHDRWDRFVEERLDGYDTHRNLPGDDGTSRMSPALRWGIVHPRQLLADVAEEPGERRARSVFRSEIAWREFYADVLLRHPGSAREHLQRKMDALPVDTDAAARRRFEAWCAGRTGFPIVDAGIRQLHTVGWMHNRVRMITASFLVKDLHLPWQWGARFFMQHLVDGDLASNQHGWQWVAGTGTDPAPFFRVFNPTAQSERFDPEGRYIRRHLPELADLPDGSIHDPGRSRPDGYPPPMVDHAAERREALARYNSIRGASR